MLLKAERVTNEYALEAAARYPTRFAVMGRIDPARTLRTFTFESDGPGAISAQVVASSPIDTTTLLPSTAGRVCPSL